MIESLKNRLHLALAFLLVAAFTASGVEEYCLYWKMDSRISGKNNEVVKVNTNDKPLPREPEQLAAAGMPDYLIVNKNQQTGDYGSRASTRTAFKLTLRCLKNDNSTYTGTNSPIWVGAYLRQSTFSYEALCYADLSSMDGKTIDSVQFKYNISSIVNGGAYVDMLADVFEQDKGTYSASAIYNTYDLSTWTNSVAKDTQAYNAATGWYSTNKTTGLKTLIQAYANSTKTNNGVILAGNGNYWGYYWVISACTLVVWNSAGNSAPTDIALSASSVNENANTGTTVGALTTTDADAGQTHTYTLVSGTGDADNAKFQISSSNLQTNYVFNYEMGSSYSVRIRTTDNGSPSQYYEEAFAITISNVNDAPVAGAGKALDFDAADDVVDCGSGSVVDDMSAFTVEAWIYPKSVGENVLGRIVDKAATTTPTAGWCFRLGTNNYLSFIVDYNTTNLQLSSSNSTITLNAWNHVAVTWDGTATATNAHIYVNGTQTSYQTTADGSTTRQPDASSNLRIGNSADGTRTFDGYIDEVRIWNAVRTATQIQDSMYTHVNPASTNLVAYYPMDATKGTAVRDFTSNANTGECANMTDADWISSTAWQSRSVNDIDVLIHTPGYDEDASATLTLSQVTGPTKGKLRYTNNSTHYLLFYTPTMNQTGSDSYVFRVSDGTATADYTITPSITNASNGPYAGSGKAVNFDTASSKHVDLPSNCMISTGSAFTLEFWVKPNGPNNHQRIFIQGATDCSNEIIMAYWYSGHIEFLRKTSGTSGTANKASGAISDAVWTHVAWTYDGASTDNVYVNGVSSTGTVGGGSVGYDGNNFIGRHLAGNYFNGQLDEIRLWDYSRTSGETSGDMYTALTGSEEGLVAYWRMDRASGDQLRDWSTNGYSGRLHNMVDGDWVASIAWKNRTTANTTALTHSGGFDPDADAITLSQVTAPSQGSLSFNNTNRTVTYTPLAGSSGTYTYTYRIADAYNRATSDYDMSVQVTSDDPYVVTYSPADDATGVSPTANLVLTFNEAVDAETGNIVIRKSADGTAFETIGVTSGNVAGSGTTTITINPTGTFVNATGYYVEIDATAFDDAGGNSYAGISGNSAWNFTAGTNAHRPVAGSGNALVFDGVDEYVALPSAVMISDNTFTFEFWIRPNSPVNYARVLTQGSSASPSRQLSAYWYTDHIEVVTQTDGSNTDPQAASGTITNDNSTWTHVAWTCNGTTHTIYKNGAVSSGSTGGANAILNVSNYIGKGGSLWKGAIDEVRLWDAVRTQSEIQDNMYAPLTGSESNLAGYWRMDTTAGTTLKDYSSGARNGTLTNMEDGDWAASETWKYRSTSSVTALTHSAGWEPDGDAVTLSQITAPSQGSLSFNNTNKTVTYTPEVGSSGTFTYAFDMSDGTLKDTFDMSVAVTANTTAHRPVAGSGNALDFDNGNDHVTLPNGCMVSGAYTLEFWVKPNTPDEADRVFIQGATGCANYMLVAFWKSATSKFEFVRGTSGTSANSITATGAITNSAWSHVAWSFDGASTHKVYVNGRDSSSTPSGTAYGYDGANYIGRRGATGNYWSGQLDEIRLWSDVRTQTEIQDNLYAPLTGSESNLVGYWRMDTTAGTTLKNYASGGGYDGTLVTMEDADWVASEAWKNRSTNSATPLTHSAGWEPDGDAVTLAQVTAPSNGTLSFNNTNKTVTFTPQQSLGGTFTYSFQMNDGALKDTFDMSVAVTEVAQDNYANWTYSKDLFINTTSTGANVSGNVVNFPLLVRLNDNNMTFSQALSTGYDLRFAKSNGTHLPYERERWDNTNHLAEFWVLCDTVFGSNSSQYIKMYWGKSGAGDSASAENVFKTAQGYDFGGVWHLHNNSYLDATTNNNDGVNYTSTDSASVIAGGRKFDGNDYIEIPKSTTLNQPRFTVSCWTKVNGGAGTYRQPVSYRNEYTGYNFYAADNNTWQFWIGYSTEYAQVTDGAITLNNWYHVAGTFDGSNGIIYVDGVPKDTITGITHTANTVNNFRIGKDSNYDLYYYNGLVDEVRICDINRSPDWIKLCYETQKPGATVVSEDLIELLKLRMRNNIGTGTSDTCKLYTDNWAVIFDEDDGAGVKWLSDETSYREDRGANQLNTNLFYIRASNTNSYALAGQLSLLSYIDSLSCVLRQKVTINSQPWVVDYTVYGSGRMFVNASTEAPFTTYDPAGGVEFRVESNATKKAYYSETATASTSNYILHSDTADGRFDILLAPFEDWSQASGFCATTGNYYGYIDDDWQLNSGNKQSWTFLVDFAHKRWNDTAGVGSHVDDFRTPDSLSFIKGTVRYEKAWEEKLIGHWRLDDGTSGSADAGTATDFSGCGHTGTIKGCTWTTGKLNSGLSLSGGTDSVKITNATDFDNAWEFTVCAWIKKTGTTESNTMIFGKASRQTNKDFKLCCNTDKLVLYLFNISVTGATSLGTGWRHVAATYNKHTGTVLLYVDGKPDALYMGIPTLAFGTGVVSIGNSFTGVLDDVRYYSKVLPEDAIKGIYKNGFVPDRGLYMLRSDNNNTVHFYIDGTSAVPRRFPIFQIANYWASAKPGFVFRDGVALTEYTDYLTGVDNTYHVLTLGFKSSVTAASTRIYIDDNDASGALMVGPMKTLTYGASGSDYYVKNTSSDRFGAAGSNEFYFYWKMTNSTPPSTDAKDGELYLFKSSEESGSAGELISACDNMLPSYDTSGNMGSHDHFTTTYTKSASMSTANPPTYTVVEASPTRVRLKINTRTIDGANLDYNLKSIWTIYPTGQIFKYDTVTSIVNASNKIDYELAKWYMTYEAKTSYVSEANFRGGTYGGSTTADFAVALIGSSDTNGSKQLFTGNADTLAYISNTNSGGIRYYGTTDRTNTVQPFIYAWYLDIRDWNMSNAYIDSVCEAVKHINFTAGNMITGSRRADTYGDINGDGFNESEGAYMLTASNNSVNFTLEAQAGTDDCRFYPVLNISNYTSASKPKYVNLHTSSDTVTMLEGYGYNCYLNDASDYLVVQLDTVLCVDTRIYISADNDLAVTLSEFLAKPGDGNDTVCWRTESEHENLGFNLYRRVNREFLDSVQKIIDTATVDSLVPEEALLFRNKTIDYVDTQWVRVNQDMIPGAEGGTSADPRDYEWFDRNVYNGVLYEYKLEMISFTQEREEKGPIQVKPMVILPREYMLFHNYPNPMRIYTNIRFDLPVKTKVALYIYNLQGRRITQIIKPNKVYKPGYYMIRWNGTDERGRQLASGPYVYRLVAGNYAKARLMIVIR